MTKSAQSALFEIGEHAGKRSSVKDINVCDPVLSRNVQDRTKASQMKNIEAFPMLGIYSPIFANA